MTRAQIERLYLLRRDLLRLRNAVGPLVEVCRRLEHDKPMVRPTMRPLFTVGQSGPRPSQRSLAAR
jgi:magnesium transporter